MPDETDHERVVGALDDLLTRCSDPRTADRETFLRARYDAGLGWVHFEPGFGGLGVAASWQQVVEDRVALLGAPAPGSGDFVGMHQAAASINAVGTHEQKSRFLPPIFTGEESWCQLFSEPGAGSDLAGLSTMAVRDGDEWVVHGQKVWTSGARGAAASINAVGTHEQKARFLPPIFTGEESWCQLFSEPGAGSDLAGLSTTAVRDGDEWLVHGQKVWTSGARGARWAILVARTDPDVPKHRGLTFFVCDMQLPGIEIRPLRQADGAAHFNEVFLDGVRLPDDLRLGDPGQGWAVSLVGLHSEREGVGDVMPTPIGDVLAEWSRPRVPSAIDDVHRQRVAGAWIEARLLELSSSRSHAAQGRVGATPVGSLQKVASAGGESTHQFAARRPDGTGGSGRVRLRRRAPRRRCRGRPVAVDAGHTLARQLDRGRHRRDPTQHHRGAASGAAR